MRRDGMAGGGTRSLYDPCKDEVTELLTEGPPTSWRREGGSGESLQKRVVSILVLEERYGLMR